MSGIAMTAAATSSASSAQASAPAPAASVAPSSSASSASSAPAPGVITGMTSDTRQFVIRLFSIAMVVFTAAILAVLLYRVWLDGNAPLTAQITSGLINEIPYLLGFLAAIIVGEPVGTALVARALPAILGGMASALGAPTSSGSSGSSGSSAQASGSAAPTPPGGA